MKCLVCHQETSILELPTLPYGKGRIHPSCLPLSSLWQYDVTSFRKKFGLTVLTSPQVPPKETMHRWIILIEEEIDLELIGAITTRDLESIADGIADSIYILLGLAVECGINMSPIWAEVQRTNMLKEGGGTREDGKILKPEGWKPPRIRELLEKQGFIWNDMSTI